MIKKISEYYEFIENCKNKQYEGVTHIHHILPKFMGGTDDKDNLIELSVTDHIQAHIILAKNVDEVYRRAAWWSVAILKQKWIGDEDMIMENIRKSVTGINNPFYGKKHTTETKKKISESHPYPFKGKTYEEFYGTERSEDIKKKISQSKAKYKKPVLQFDLDGNFIKEWDSQKEAIRKTKIKRISRVCNGHGKTAGGYIWKYKNE